MVECKKEFSKIGRLLIGYSLIQIIVMVIEGIYKLVYLAIECGGTESITDQMIDEVCNELCLSGASYIVASMIGIGLVWHFRGKRLWNYDLCIKNRRMTTKVFLTLLLCFMSPQVLIGFVSGGVEAALNNFGYTMMGDLESMYGTSETLSMLFYTVLVGPIAEEVLFRGGILRSCEKHGKIFAILFSAIFFGIMHASLIQGFFATLVGIVLAYATIEYSIWWAILLHIINNGMSELISILEEWSGEVACNVVFYVIYGGSLVFTILFVYHKRRDIIAYIRMNRGESGIWKQAMFRVSIMIYVVLNIGMALTGITLVS